MPIDLFFSIMIIYISDSKFKIRKRRIAHVNLLDWVLFWAVFIMSVCNLEKWEDGLLLPLLECGDDSEMIEASPTFFKLKMIDAAMRCGYVNLASLHAILQFRRGDVAEFVVSTSWVDLRFGTQTRLLFRCNVHTNDP